MIAFLSFTGVNSDLYNLLLVLHIVAVVAAFGVPLAISAIIRTAREQGGAAGQATTEIAHNLFAKLAVPATIAAVILGVLLVTDSGKAWSYSDPWISIAFTIVLLLLLLSFIVIAPAIKKTGELIANPANAEEVGGTKARLGMSLGLYHLGFLLIIAVMIWKP